MEEATFRYAVLAARPEDLKPSEIANAVSAARKIPFQDAARLARMAWGVIEEGMSKDEATDLAARLKAQGVEAVVLPSNLMEEVPQPLVANALNFLPGQLEAFVKNAPKETFPLDGIRLLAAAGVKQTIVSKIKVKEGPSPTQRAVSMGLMMAGLPIPIGGKSREVEKTKETTDLFFYLDLYLRKPTRRIRVDAQDFNFACLKARMGYSVPQNFRTLVQELARLCPQASTSRGARILLDGGAVATMGYDAATDLERESRWLLTLDALKNP